MDDHSFFFGEGLDEVSPFVSGNCGRDIIFLVESDDVDDEGG